jgi:hypothetical protein
LQLKAASADIELWITMPRIAPSTIAINICPVNRKKDGFGCFGIH